MFHGCATIYREDIENFPARTSTNISCTVILMLQVAAGGTHSVVLTHEGHVWTWGQPWPPGDMYMIIFHMFFKL